MRQGIAPVVLSTDRLQLDQPCGADVAAIAVICADPDIGRWIPVMPQPYGLTDARWFVEEFVPRGWAMGKELTWVLRRPGGDVMGSVGVNVASEEIGYWLGKDYRGQGYMREAVEVVIDWWFAQGATRMVWKCLRGNAQSAAVARVAGFRFQQSAPTGQQQTEENPSRFWYAVIEATDSRDPQPDWPQE